MGHKWARKKAASAARAAERTGGLGGTGEDSGRATPEPTSQPSHARPSTPVQPPAAPKPREERPYTDFYPDLNPSIKLHVKRDYVAPAIDTSELDAALSRSQTDEEVGPAVPPTLPSHSNNTADDHSRRQSHAHQHDVNGHAGSGSIDLDMEPAPDPATVDEVVDNEGSSLSTRPSRSRRTTGTSARVEAVKVTVSEEKSRRASSVRAGSPAGEGVIPSSGDTGLSETPNAATEDRRVPELSIDDSAIAVTAAITNAAADEPISVTPQKRKLSSNNWTSEDSIDTGGDGQQPGGGAATKNKRMRQASEPPQESPLRTQFTSLLEAEGIERQHSAPPTSSTRTSKPQIALPSLSHPALPSLVDRDLSKKLHKLPKAKCVKVPFVPELVGPADPWAEEEVPYRRPEGHYIRYVEPVETELYEMTEYDMDEQDRYWLSAFNAERKEKEGEPEVPESFFESVMDKLDKEWFNLMKVVPKKEREHNFPDESVCNICGDEEAENLNAIVFCDGCNVAVHQDCYGIPYIPEGQWLCRKCMLSPEAPVSCIFCPNEGGAFKQTNTNRWAHLLCAIWIPEVGISNPVYMEPIDQISKVPRSRWKLICYLCRIPHGACIQCSHSNCYSAFHVTCARKAGLFMERHDEEEGATTEQFCDRHGPKDHVIDPAALESAMLDGDGRYRRRDKKKGGGSSSAGNKRKDGTDSDFMPSDNEAGAGTGDGDDGSGSDFEDEPAAPKKRGRGRPPAVRPKPRAVIQERANKAARAHAKSYAPTSIVAPQYVITRVLAELSRAQVRKKSTVVQKIARYWSLKRASRRGAPLLKRLHLEPWTATAGNKEDEEARMQKLEVLLNLRRDLEKVRMLVEHVHKREKAKLRALNAQKEIIEFISEPVAHVLDETVETLAGLDKEEYFQEPIDAAEVPDYYEVVTNPMDFKTILGKAAAHQYTSVDELRADLQLICANAMLYNNKDTPYYKAAVRLEQRAGPVLDEAEEKLRSYGYDAELGVIPMLLPDELFELSPQELPKPVTPPPESEEDEEDDEEMEDEQEEEEEETAEPEEAEAEPADSNGKAAKGKGKADRFEQTPRQALEALPKEKLASVVDSFLAGYASRKEHARKSLGGAGASDQPEPPRRRARVTDHGAVVYGSNLPLPAWKDVLDFEMSLELQPLLEEGVALTGRDYLIKWALGL